MSIIFYSSLVDAGDLEGFGAVQVGKEHEVIMFIQRSELNAEGIKIFERLYPADITDNDLGPIHVIFIGKGKIDAHLTSHHNRLAAVGNQTTAADIHGEGLDYISVLTRFARTEYLHLLQKTHPLVSSPVAHARGLSE